jgi:hypothetical protein
VPDETLALSGVTVTDNITTLESKDINVTISTNEDGSFLVTYLAKDEIGNEAVGSAQFHY